MLTSHSHGVSASVWNAVCRKGTWTTATCARLTPTTASHNQMLLKMPEKALRVRQRSLKALNTWKKTSVVKAIVWAREASPVPPGIRPSGRIQSVAASVPTPMIAPTK